MKTCDYCGSENRVERERCFSCNAPFSVKNMEKRSLLDGPATNAQKKKIDEFYQRGNCFKNTIEIEMLSKKICDIESLDKLTAAVILDKLFNMRNK